MTGMYSRNVKKGYIYRIREDVINAIYTFQFNPTEYQRSRTSEYEFLSPPGSSIPTAYFKCTTSETISLTLLLDSTGSRTYNGVNNVNGISAHLAELESYTWPNLADMLAGLDQFVSPPEIRLGLGIDFWNVVVTSVNFNIVMFDSLGIPIRAYADLEFKTHYTDMEVLRNRLFDLYELRTNVTVNPINEGIEE